MAHEIKTVPLKHMHAYMFISKVCELLSRSWLLSVTKYTQETFLGLNGIKYLHIINIDPSFICKTLVKP